MAQCAAHTHTLQVPHMSSCEGLFWTQFSDTKAVHFSVVWGQLSADHATRTGSCLISLAQKETGRACCITKRPAGMSMGQERPRIS